MIVFVITKHGNMFICKADAFANGLMLLAEKLEHRFFDTYGVIPDDLSEQLQDKPVVCIDLTNMHED